MFHVHRYIYIVKKGTEVCNVSIQPQYTFPTSFTSIVLCSSVHIQCKEFEGDRGGKRTFYILKCRFNQPKVSYILNCQVIIKSMIDTFSSSLRQTSNIKFFYYSMRFRTDRLVLREALWRWQDLAETLREILANSQVSEERPSNFGHCRIGTINVHTEQELHVLPRVSFLDINTLTNITLFSWLHCFTLKYLPMSQKGLRIR